jgi:hypothetical protein
VLNGGDSKSLLLNIRVLKVLKVPVLPYPKRRKFKYIYVDIKEDK